MGQHTQKEVDSLHVDPSVVSSRYEYVPFTMALPKRNIRPSPIPTIELPHINADLVYL